MAQRDVEQHRQTVISDGAVFHGRYQIVRCLKSGGMGAIYECIHLTTRKRRALKVMLPEVVARQDLRDRFELEARVTSEIESEHIVETFDAGVDEATGAPFLVMELLRGDDLDGMLKGRGSFNAEETVALLSQVALALDRTHAARIIHRDLKPHNLFLTTRDDGSWRVKILDFGIAKMVADGTKTARQTASIGTPVYMAPEQATGDGTIGPPADLYALAHIAYTLLTGSEYWMEDYQSLPMIRFLNKMLAGSREPASERAARRGVTLPVAFDAWFARATALAPEDRFHSAFTQIAELATALGVGAPPISPGQLLYDRLLNQAEMPTLPVALQESSPAQPDSPANAGVATAPLRADEAKSSGASSPSAGSGATTSALLSTTVPVTPPSRSTWRVVAGALLLLVLGIGTTVVITQMGRGTAPTTTGAPSASSEDVKTAMPSAMPAPPTGTLGATMTAPSSAAPPLVPTASTPKATGPLKPLTPAKPTAPARPTATAAPFDPTRLR